MTHITIKNLGPIKNVEFDLNKVNVFMGPQSSGKSTIAKIISYCSWFEKKAILEDKASKYFYSELLEFHNLEENYFCDESYIEYQSNNCRIVFKGEEKNNAQIKIIVNKDNVFKNERIEFIPAERNFVTIPGIGKYNDSNDNALGFLYDWFDAKQDITKQNKYKLPLLSLNEISYYYDKDNNRDTIVLNDGKELLLRHVSSGLISVTPLLVVYNYVLNTIYQKKRIKSPFEIVNLKNKIERMNSEKASENYAEMINSMQKLEVANKEVADVVLPAIQKEFVKLLGFDSDYNYTKVIIEEPELNLFPNTQQELMYYMLSLLNSDERDHQLVLTTHSPYILFSLNNCMIGGLVKNNIPEEDKNSFASHHAWVDPKEVSIWEIEKGEIRRIQDKDGIVEDNYLNKAYKENSAEYMSLLNYFEDEE